MALSQNCGFSSQNSEICEKLKKKKKTDFEPKMKIVRSFVCVCQKYVSKNDLIFAV